MKPLRAASGCRTGSPPLVACGSGAGSCCCVVLLLLCCVVANCERASERKAERRALERRRI